MNPAMRECEVCGELKMCERVSDPLFKKLGKPHLFWICAPCALAAARYGVEFTEPK